MKRIESRKSHSWWWDSHSSPKNSKWLAENLEVRLLTTEMDRRVKHMLKLIEEDGDSFAKKAEMYYQKRPELVSQVEGFYRMYRSLAERHDLLTAEWRKNILSDLQSQDSGISDVSSDLPSICTSPDQRPRRRKSHQLAAGGSSSDVRPKGDKPSSPTDSEPESEDSSINIHSVLSGNEDDQEVSGHMVLLEIELHEAKEKLLMLEDENTDLLARIREHEERAKTANSALGLQNKIGALEKENEHEDSKMEALLEELRIAKEMLEGSEKEIATLKLEKKQLDDKIQDLHGQIDTAQREIMTWKTKLDTEKQEVSKLQERLAMAKNSLSDRDHEIHHLKKAVSDAEQKKFPKKANTNAEMSRSSEEQICLEERLRGWESCGHSLEEEIRKTANEKRESEESLQSEIEVLKLEIAKRSDCIEVLHDNLEYVKSERDELKGYIISLKAKVNSREDRIVRMKKHLHHLYMEHVKVTAEAEGAHRLVDELLSKGKELEDEIEQQRTMILERDEEKREAIRQLCFSLEHYRYENRTLWQAVIDHKIIPVLTT
ncbi:hypothetical protein GOBAR_AA30980 [Gossypium barbadense]|uniref:NAB domain-containing protein n=1 Tax=Gossypium barbadense TaxID=3634 RepID=A0A2P5WF36_GOSBA|nr:hypothetical protein GOBAR_AA30980 [Gossypium barbadense]